MVGRRAAQKVSKGDMDSYHGESYGFLRSQQRSNKGWRFDFSFNQNMTSKDLDADAPSSEDRPVHDLRLIAWQELARQRQRKLLQRHAHDRSGRIAEPQQLQQGQEGVTDQGEETAPRSSPLSSTSRRLRRTEQRQERKEEQQREPQQQRRRRQHSSDDEHRQREAQPPPATPPPNPPPASAVAHLQTPVADKSDASRDTVDKKAEEIAPMLERDARQRLEPCWLEVELDDERDAIIREALQDDEIRQLWKDVVIKAGGTPSSPIRHLPARRTGKPTARNPRAAGQKRKRSSDSVAQMDERALEVAISKLCNALRIALGRQSGFLPAKKKDEGWGTCLPNGSFEMPNPDPVDPERNKPDIPFFSRNLKHKTAKKGQKGAPQADWADVVTTIGVKLHARKDLSLDVTTQCLRHARKVIRYHPLCTRSHQVTISGTRLRLWQFTPTSYSTSRAYSFSEQADELAIGRILALLVASDADSLLTQWVPPPQFEVQAADEEGKRGRSELWEWLDVQPRVVYARPEIWGSRTAVFGGRARLVQPSDAAEPNIDGRLKRLDLTGSTQGTARLTMVKCSFLPKHLLGHEKKMQMHIAKVAGTPDPIGDLSPDVDAALPPSHKEAAESRWLYAVVYQHPLGEKIPDDMAEQHLCNLFRRLTKQLRRISRTGAHYRDLNTGNILRRVGGDGQPELVLVDHGNMRFDGKRRGPRDVDTKGTTRSFFAIAQEDARSANPLFLPSSMAYVEEALQSLKDGEAEAAKAAKAGIAEESEDVAAREEENAQKRRAILLYSHSHIDDLESACYLLLWYGLRRSFHWSHDSYKELDAKLRDQKQKRAIWESRNSWSTTINDFCPAMSDAWKSMMRKLRTIIVEAQAERRTELGSDPALNTKTPEELFGFSKTEKKCFKEVAGVYKDQCSLLSTAKFKKPKQPAAAAQLSKGTAQDASLDDSGSRPVAKLPRSSHASTSTSGRGSARSGSLLGPSRNSQVVSGQLSSREDGVEIGNGFAGPEGEEHLRHGEEREVSSGEEAAGGDVDMDAAETENVLPSKRARTVPSRSGTHEPKRQRQRGTRKSTAAR